MKRYLFQFLFVLSLYTSVSAQDKQYPIPDFDNVPYYYDEATNTLHPIEKAIYKVEMKAKGLFGAGAYIVVQGSAATLRYSKNQKIQFIIHFDDARTEPSTLYTLIQFSINTKNNNNQREYLFKSQGLGHSETNNTQIAMTPKKIGDGLYLLTFNGQNPVGEFALTIDKTKQGYAFGIDEGSGIQAQFNSESSAMSQTVASSSNVAAKSYPEPDFDNMIYLFNPAENTLVDLERAINAKSEGAFGFLNLNSSISVSGKKSPVKITANTKNSFIVRLATAADPYTVVELVPCLTNEEKQTRDYSPSTKKDQQSLTAIQLKFKRINSNLYLITPLTPLEQGNYFFINKALKEKSIFAFEIN